MYAKFEKIIEEGFTVPNWLNTPVCFVIGNLIDRKLMGAVNEIAQACDENFPCALCEATLAEIRNLMFGPEFYEGKARTAAKHEEVYQSNYAEDATRNLGYRGKPLFRFNVHIIVLIDPMHLFMRTFEVIFAVTVFKILQVVPNHEIGFHIIEKLVRSSSGQQHFRFYKSADSTKSMGHGVSMAHNASDGRVLQAILIKFPFVQLFDAIERAWNNLPEAMGAARAASETVRPGRGRSSARGRGRGAGENRARARAAQASRGGVSRANYWAAGSRMDDPAAVARASRSRRGRAQPQPQPAAVPADEPVAQPEQQMTPEQQSVLSILKTRVPAIWCDYYNLVASISVLPGHPRKMEESLFMETAARNRQACHDVFGSTVEVNLNFA